MIGKRCDPITLARLVDDILHRETGEPDSISRYLENHPDSLEFLPLSERAGFAEHVSRCGECGDFLKEQVAIGLVLKKSEFRIPATFNEDQVRRLEERIVKRAAFLSTAPAGKNICEPGIEHVFKKIWRFTKETIMADVLTSTGKVKWAAIGAVCGMAVTLVVYFSIIYPWPTSREAVGTMGGAQKAERYRNQQMSQKDIVTQVPTTAQQREQIQKILAKINYVTIMKSPYVQKASQDAVAMAWNSSNQAGVGGGMASGVVGPGMQGLAMTALQNAVSAVANSAPNSVKSILMNTSVINSLQNATNVALQNTIAYQVNSSMQNAFLLVCNSSLQNLAFNSQSMQGAMADPKMQDAIAKALQDSLQGFLASSSLQKVVTDSIAMNYGILLIDSQAMTGIQTALKDNLEVAIRYSFIEMKDKVVGIGALSPATQAAIQQAVLATYGAAIAVSGVQGAAAQQAVGLAGSFQLIAMQGLLSGQIDNNLELLQGFIGMQDKLAESTGAILMSGGNYPIPR